MKAVKILVLLPIIIFLGLGASVASAQQDTAAPVISAVRVTDLTQTSATISWRTDETSDSQVRFGISPDALTSGVTSPAKDTVHSVHLSDLSPDTRYLFEIQSTDTNGNAAIDNYGSHFYSFITREPRVNHRAFVGIVFEEPGKTATLIQQGAGEPVTITLPDNYTIKTPGGPRAGTFQIGARVVILAERVDEDWVALRVLVKPVKPNLPVTGVVVSVEPDSVALIAPDGARYAFSPQLPIKGWLPEML
jgi:Purple acid Phosphatase, N-terminal domain